MTTHSGPSSNDMTLEAIGQRLDCLKVGRIHRRVVWAIGLGLFFDIYELFTGWICLVEN